MFSSSPKYIPNFHFRIDILHTRAHFTFTNPSVGEYQSNQAKNWGCKRSQITTNIAEAINRRLIRVVV
jgi:hypothetical protein